MNFKNNVFVYALLSTVFSHLNIVAQEGGYDDAEVVIQAHCEKEWPDDFKMRLYCVNEQKEGLSALREGKPNDISEQDFGTINRKCAGDWPSDFKMRAYCHQEQYEAVRELRGGTTNDVLDHSSDAREAFTPEESAAYESAVNADPAKREGAIVAFIEANPRSALVEYAIGSYLQLMQEYQNQGQSRKVFSAGEKLLSLRPDELNTLHMTAIAAYQLQRFDIATVYGEKVYAQKPNAGLAFVLASSYGQLKNEEGQLEYGETACSELAPKDCYQILSALAKLYADRSQWVKAIQYTERAIEGLEVAERPPQTSRSDWDNYVNSETAENLKLPRFSGQFLVWDCR